MVKNLPLKLQGFMSLSLFFSRSLFCTGFFPFGESKPYVSVLVYIEIFQFAKWRQNLTIAVSEIPFFMRKIMRTLSAYLNNFISLQWNHWNSEFTLQALGVRTTNLKKESMALKAPGLWSWSLNQSIPNGKGKRQNLLGTFPSSTSSAKPSTSKVSFENSCFRQPMQTRD